MTRWRDTGKWTVRDEDGRLHWKDCRCAERDGMNCCRSVTLAPFDTEAEAQTHAAALEAATGYACAARPLQAR